MAIEPHEILIIGSGHAGGMAAYVLAQKGFKCVMLNAGPIPDLDRDREERPTQAYPYRMFTRPRDVIDHYVGAETKLNAFVNPTEIPYSHDEDKPYVWVRNRLVGGRSLFWGRQSFRLSDLEFKGRDNDGFGENWPVDLAEMTPFYERVEQIFRLSGRPEGLSYYPDSKFVVVDSAPDSALVATTNKANAKNGLLISKPRTSLGVDGLASSFNLLLPAAVRSGNLTIVPDAVVREITVDKATGLANGAHYVERHTKREVHIKAKVVILAAGTLESTRLLLNSGLANSSGVLGHYLCDQMYGNTAVAMAPKGTPAGAARGILVPFHNARQKHPDFIRRWVANVSTGGDATPDMFATYGADLESKLAEHAGRACTAQIMGETLARHENHVRINKDVVDPWGIPTLHISAAYGDNETKMHLASQDLVAEMWDNAGFQVLFKDNTRRGPGQSIHELGTCRMGDDPKKSVLNRWNQAHDIKNLLVVDGGAFVSCGWQNPTLTICALAMRASERLAETLKPGGA